MYRINLPPISSNEGYRGRRFCTPELKKFKEDMAILLPKIAIPVGKLQVHYLFGVSSKQNDVDNLIKFVQDSLSEGYAFNDKVIYKITAEKQDVEKGAEFISFLIEPYATSRN